MIQDQLVDYIVAQKKAGVARAAIASALVGVGWQAADVEDTLKKVEGNVGQPVVQPAAVSPVQSSLQRSDFAKPAMGAGNGPSPTASKPMSAMPATSSTPGGAKPAGGNFSSADIIGGVSGPKAGASQPVRISDFVGSASSSAAGTAGPAKSPATSQTRPAAASGGVVAVASGKKLAMIVEIVVIVILAGLSIFLYMQNASLSAKVSNLSAAAPNPSAAGTSAQVSDLQNQVQTLTTSQTALQGQVTTLTGTNTDLQTQLGFFVTPSGTAAAIPGTVAGTLATVGSAKATYSIHTQYGAVIFVKNSTDAKTAAALKPLIGSSVTLAGTYIPGSDALTVVSVNGTPVNAPAPVATTTPASSSTSGGTQ